MAGKRLANALNIAEIAAIAQRRLPKGIYEFIERGAEDEVTLRENRESIKRVLLRQRVGVDVSKRSPATSIFGVPQSMPMGIAATGLAALVHHDGERKLARAARAAGVPYTIGTSNFTATADCHAICGDLLWRLIYPNKNRDLFYHHVDMARDIGVKTIVVTMDSPVNGNREYLRHSGFSPGNMNIGTYADVLTSPPWLFGTLLRYLLGGGWPQFADMPEGQRRYWGGTYSWAALADDWTWNDIRTLRNRWKDRLVVKGLSTAEDARKAAECGVDGIIVSNHGGRMLDGCVPSFQALPSIVDAVAPRLTVMVDGGFTRSADMLKAIAMGASSVWVGRATLFGLAAGGEAGATRALAIFQEEFNRAMALTGVSSLAELDRSHVVYQNSPM